jgi:hypothetical protein
MNNRNEHKNGINPHDLAAARIVQGAMEAAKLPPAAARAVFRAMGAAGVQAPKLELDHPHPTDEQVERHLATAEERGMGVVTIDSDRAKWEEQTRLAARRIEAHQEGLVLAMVRERMELDSIEMRDLEPGELQGFDYPPTETAPGYREYELDGQPLVRFYSPEVAFDEGNMLVNLRYRIAV